MEAGVCHVCHTVLTAQVRGKANSGWSWEESETREVPWPLAVTGAVDTDPDPDLALRGSTGQGLTMASGAVLAAFIRLILTTHRFPVPLSIGHKPCPFSFSPSSSPCACSSWAPSSTPPCRGGDASGCLQPILCCMAAGRPLRTISSSLRNLFFKWPAFPGVSLVLCLLPVGPSLLNSPVLVGSNFQLDAT